VYSSCNETRKRPINRFIRGLCNLLKVNLMYQNTQQQLHNTFPTIFVNEKEAIEYIHRYGLTDKPYEFIEQHVIEWVGRLADSVDEDIEF